MPLNIATDQNLNGVSAPVLRQIISSGASYTPTEDKTVILGADVVITINGNAIGFLAGSSFIMLKNVTYGFSIDIQLGIS